MGGKPRLTALPDGLVRTLDALATFLARHQGDGAVIGGIAVIACGVPRVTRDVDIAFTAGRVPMAALVAELTALGIAPRIPDALTFATASHVLLLRHASSGVDVDLSFATLPFEHEAIASADRKVLAGAALPVARPEDLVIYKAIAWRPQDQQDVERLLALHGDAMDLTRVRARVGELSDALEVDRRSDLDALIDRVLAAPR